jgi:hypothetical protein
MESAGYTEIGRLSPSAGTASTYGSVVPIQIRNDHDLTARVVMLAHRHHDLDEHRIVVSPHQTVSTYCALGQVVLVVFNVDTNSFHSGHVLNVAGSFTFPIP